MKDIRPTSGRVLSALFSILGDRVEGASFLDLFAGTGRVGLEALRRGARSCLFVESVRARAEEIRKISGGNIVLGLEVRRAVSWILKRDIKFGIIFADPPYNSGWPEVLPAIPNLDRIFDDNCIFILEHSSREPVTLLNNPYNLEITSSREYGETSLTFLRPTN